MLKRTEVDAEEERLREAVNALADDRRRAFYREAGKRLRDPDTYAALNWFFIAGLHHFYLGKWQWGVLDLVVFITGMVLIFSGDPLAGVLAIVAVSAWEFWALFRAQIIVQDWNNGVYRRLLEKYRQP